MIEAGIDRFMSSLHFVGPDTTRRRFRCGGDGTGGLDGPRVDVGRPGGWRAAPGEMRVGSASCGPGPVRVVASRPSSLIILGFTYTQ